MVIAVIDLKKCPTNQVGFADSLLFGDGLMADVANPNFVLISHQRNGDLFLAALGADCLTALPAVMLQKLKEISVNLFGRVLILEINIILWQVVEN